MTNIEKEEAKNILYKWGSSRLLIDFENKETARIKEIISSMTDISSMVYSHGPKAKTNTSPVERKVINSIELCEERLKRITERVEEFTREGEIINEILDGMEFDRQYILKAKYFENQSWNSITVRYPYYMSRRNFFRIHSAALEEFYSKYKDMIK